MTLLSATDVSVVYATSRGTLAAVDGVSLAIGKGETVGLVGESGCGKSTLGRAVLGLTPVAAGRVAFDGAPVPLEGGSAMRAFRRRAQMIFQDPFGSLNPRQTVGRILVTPLAVHGIGTAASRAEAVAHMLDRVGLPPEAAGRYPHEFSGGQRQRIGIARALILEPQFVVCDEPVSALDLSIQAQILNLLVGLKSSFDLSYLFISHDLSVVRYFSDRALVMYRGRIVESGPAERVWSRPRHPYTQALLAAVPDPARRGRPRAPPAAGAVEPPAAGCRFAPRCPFATDICRSEVPPLRPVEAGHEVACHHADRTA